MIATEEVGSYLGRLSSSDPTPGGGAAGALHLAQAAALISMVALFTTGQKFAAVQARAQGIAQRAQRCRDAALELASQDERVFGVLITAYRMPGDTKAQQVEKTAAIQQALVGAAAPQVSTVDLASELVELAEDLLHFGNRTVLSDISAAVEAARAAMATALVTVEINIAAIHDAQVRQQLGATVRRAESGMQAAEKISAAVREQVRR